MHPTAQRILDSLDDPTALEALYRRDPDGFRDAFTEASGAAGDSPTLRVWRARLEYREPIRSEGRQRLWQALGVALAIGLILRLLALRLGDEWTYPRFGPSLVVLGLGTYFWLGNRGRQTLVLGGVLAVGVLAYAASLPGSPDFPDSVVMALLHLPLLCWAFLGYAFTGDEWRAPTARIRFLRYNGELLILGSLVGLGAFVFSGITVALFELISKQSGEWYARNVGPFIAPAVPLVGTYLFDVVFNRRTAIASVLARVFAPLFLVMTATYLAFAFGMGHNPFVDRDFLITFNGLLLVVLGMTVFSIAERAESAAVGWIDYVNVALVAVTLVVDVIALSAILFRLSEYGLTPNRVVVLGANVVVMIHLAWMGRAYLGLIRGRLGAGDVRRVVADYLPVYVVWVTLVAFLLPPLFRFS